MLILLFYYFFLTRDSTNGRHIVVTCMLLQKKIRRCVRQFTHPVSLRSSVCFFFFFFDRASFLFFRSNNRRDRQLIAVRMIHILRGSHVRIFLPKCFQSASVWIIIVAWNVLRNFEYWDIWNRLFDREILYLKRLF